MVDKKYVYGALIIALFMTGCGSSTSDSTELGDNSTTTQTGVEVKTPKKYPHEVINNKGNGVESKLGKLTIKLYTNVKDEVEPQDVHKGVVVNINNANSETMPIQASYIGDEIVVVVYNEKGNKMKASDAIEVTDDEPVVVVNLTIEEGV